MTKVKVKKIHELAILPKKATEGSSGFDAYSVVNDIIKPRERKAIPTGLICDIPEGYEIQVRPRSGLAIKSGVSVINGPGTVDHDFVGELKILLVNHSDKEYIVNVGDRIAQLIVAPVIKAEFEWTETIKDTERSDGGFGSTGR